MLTVATRQVLEQSLYQRDRAKAQPVTRRWPETSQDGGACLFIPILGMMVVAEHRQRWLPWSHRGTCSLPSGYRAV